ncbi:MAG TPA: response regulator transcription factor [Candidatus Limnocylindrales bacterium]|nr:response regulator transcription factor [Candidatus Limnocylindrales bacterium]
MCVRLLSGRCILAAQHPEVGTRDEWEGQHLIRLGIIDDHPVFRLGLIRIFERETDLSVLWELSDLTELFTMLASYPVDVVLMDLSLGQDQDAIGAIRDIRDKHELVKVIVISASLDYEAANAARSAGASGYLPKDLSIADMVATIRGLASPNFGRASFRDLLEARARTNGNAAWHNALSRRELQVLAELRRGRSNKEIAAQLGVSITTVNKHVQQVLKKLQVRTRSQAVAMVTAEPWTKVADRGRRA